jgi:hypothetical protein
MPAHIRVKNYIYNAYSTQFYIMINRNLNFSADVWASHYQIYFFSSWLHLLIKKSFLGDWLAPHCQLFQQLIALFVGLYTVPKYCSISNRSFSDALGCVCQVTTSHFCPLQIVTYLVFSAILLQLVEYPATLLLASVWHKVLCFKCSDAHWDMYNYVFNVLRAIVASIQLLIV